jgi:nucleotide-binding universal stress UspA family protein
MKMLVGYRELNIDKKALALSQKYAHTFKADIIIMTSLQQGPSLQKDDIEEVEDRLERLKRPFDKEGINCETIVSVNYLSPGEDLVQFARDNDVELIFIGIKKTSKVGKLVFGSTAQYVLLNAPCPVVAVR